MALRVAVGWLRLFSTGCAHATRAGTWSRSAHAIVLACMLTFMAVHAYADPPGRVGRISAIEGEASLQGAEGEPFRAELNWPVTSGFTLETAPGARAEVRVGSIAVRIDAETTLRFAAIDDSNVALSLDHGTVALRMRARDTVAEVSVQTPEGDITFADVGRYRIDAGRVPGTAVVSTDRGLARVAAPDVAVDVRSGRAVEIAAGNARFVTALTDDFDAWTLARDRRDDAIAQRYVSPEMTGYEDLAYYGDWRTTAAYGTVWVPRAVPVGWAPYRHGRWQWIAPWGWTWVDAAPWGFAPFHYGRWCYLDGVWGWAPGTWVARPVYAPALVGWIGRPGWSVAFATRGFAAAGWFPLAPREPFLPWYRTSPHYLRNVNVAHVDHARIADITRAQQGAIGVHDGGMGAGGMSGNDALGSMGSRGNAGTSALRGMGGMGFANARLPNAVTVAPAAALAQGQRIAGSALSVLPDQLPTAQPLAPITPQAAAARTGTSGLGGMGGMALGGGTALGGGASPGGGTAFGAGTASGGGAAPGGGIASGGGAAPGGGISPAGDTARGAGPASNGPAFGGATLGERARGASSVSPVPGDGRGASGTGAALDTRSIVPNAAPRAGAPTPGIGTRSGAGGMGGSSSAFTGSAAGSSSVAAPQRALGGVGSSSRGGPNTLPGASSPVRETQGAMGTRSLTTPSIGTNAGASASISPPTRPLTAPPTMPPSGSWGGMPGRTGGIGTPSGLGGTGAPARAMPPAAASVAPALPPRPSYTPPAPSYAAPAAPSYAPRPAPSYAPPVQSNPAPSLHAPPRAYAPPTFTPPTPYTPPAIRSAPPPSAFGGMGGGGGMGAPMAMPRGAAPPAAAPPARGPAPSGSPRGPGGGLGGMGGRS